MDKYKVVVADSFFKSFEIEKEIFEKNNVDLIITSSKSPQDLIEHCKGADAVLCTSAPFTKEVIDSLHGCKIISKYTVGIDNINIPACTDANIWVSNVPDYGDEEVSDHALALWLACARKIARRDYQVRNGMWNIASADPIYRIQGKTFGILGFGSISRCLAKKLQSFRLGKILAYDPYVSADVMALHNVEKADWDEIMSQSDYISVHIPLADSTRGIIGANEFNMMKNTAIIINTGRGPVINEHALIDALQNHKINTAGLDVFEVEPLPESSPLLKLENTVLSDHSAWYSEESIVEMKTKACQNIIDVFNGNQPTYPVNHLK